VSKQGAKEMAIVVGTLLFMTFGQYVIVAPIYLFMWLMAK